MTGRNLLSPVLTKASADVTAFDAKVAASQEKASTSAETSARAQIKASDQMVAANARQATSSTDAAAKVTAANTRTARSSEESSAKVVTAQARAAEATRGFAEVTESSSARAAVAWHSLATKGLPLVAAAAVAITGKMAGDFEQQTNILVTAAGESQKALGQVRAGILAIAQETGTKWHDLTDGMYQVEKAGYRGADGLRILRAAAQAAREEGANLATVTNATTSVMASYHLGADQAVSVTNMLKSAAGEAKTTMELFSGSLSTVLPLASANKVSFADVAGALASLTQHGTTADEAAQELAFTLRGLAAPNNVAVQAMAQLGISSTDVAQRLGDGPGGRGLVGTLKYLSETVLSKMGPSGLVLMNSFKQSTTAADDMQRMLAVMPPQVKKLSEEYAKGALSIGDYHKAFKDLPTDQAALGQQFVVVANRANGFNDQLRRGGPAAATFSDQMKRITGGANGLNTVLQLTGDSLGGTEERIKRVAEAGRNAGNDVAGWASTQKLFNVQFDRFVQTAEAGAITVGAHLLPALTGAFHWMTDTGIPAVGGLAHGVGDVVHWFTQLPGPVKAAIETLVALKVITSTDMFAGLVASGRIMALSFGMNMSNMVASARAGAGQITAAFAEAKAAQQALTMEQFGTSAVTRATGDIAGLGAAAGVAAKGGLSALRAGASGVIGMLGGPWVVGVAAAVGALMYFRNQIEQHDAQVKADTASVKSWYEAMATKGGAAAVNAMGQIRSKQLELADAQQKLNDLQAHNVFITGRGGAQLGLSNVEIGRQAQKVADLTTEVTKGKKQWDAYWKSLTPQGQAAATLAADEATLAYAIQTTGTNSIATKNATADYNAAKQKQKDLTDQLNAVEQTEIEKLQQLENVQLGAVSSSLAATQAQSQFADAVAQYNKDAHDGQHSTKQLADESNNLAQQAISTAQAIGKQEHDQLAANHQTDDGTMANKLMLQSLKDSADHITGPGHDALMKAYNDLLKATAAADTMSASAQQMGLNVVKTFDNNTAVIHGATDAQIADLQRLGDKVTHLPGGNIIVTTDDHMARATLDALINDYNNKVVRVFTAAGQHISSATGPGGTVPFADGGWTGPGSKWQPAGIVHADEFVVPKHRVNALGGPGAVGALVGMPGYAAGGPVKPFTMHAPLAADLSAQSIAWAQGQIARLAAAAQAATAGPGGAPTSVSGNAAIVQRVAGQYGWGSGAEWNALYNVIMRESGFRNTAQNPSSTAYGMFQFLDSTWGGYGVAKTSDALFQSVAGLKYIASRYGDPLGAYRHEQQFGWYRDGTNYVPSDQLAYLHRGEAVVPAAVNQGRPFTPTGAPGYSPVPVHTSITVAAPQVNVQARVFLGTREITDIVRIEATTIVDAAAGQLADLIHYSG